MVDVDKAGLQPKLQQVPFDVNILSDAKDFIQMLKAELKVHPNRPDFSGWVDRVMKWKNDYDPVTEDMYKPRKYPHPYAFTRILSEEMKSNDIFAADCGGNIVVSNHALRQKLVKDTLQTMVIHQWDFHLQVVLVLLWQQTKTRMLFVLLVMVVSI